MTRPGSRNWGTDVGAATVWVLGLATVVIAVALAVVVRTSAVLARHRLERTADLAALAAADQIGRSDPPCAAAARIATANGAVLGACLLQRDTSARGGTVAITVRRTVHFALLGNRMLTARARAGRVSKQPVPSSSDGGNAGRNTVGRIPGAVPARGAAPRPPPPLNA